MSDHIDLQDVHRVVGEICSAATKLEQELEDTVVELVGSAQASALVQGERGANLLRMVQRLVRQHDGEASDKERLLAIAKEASALLDRRDLVVHSVWLVKNDTPGQVTGTRTRRTDIHSQLWTLDELETLRQALATTEINVFEETRRFLGERSSFN